MTFKSDIMFNKGRTEYFGMGPKTLTFLTGCSEVLLLELLCKFHPEPAARVSFIFQPVSLTAVRAHLCL